MQAMPTSEPVNVVGYFYASYWDVRVGINNSLVLNIIMQINLE
jgi:hypothetical protein